MVSVEYTDWPMTVLSQLEVEAGYEGWYRSFTDGYNILMVYKSGSEVWRSAPFLSTDMLALAPSLTIQRVVGRHFEGRLYAVDGIVSLQQLIEEL